MILRKMMEEEWDFDPGREKMFDACVQVCRENSLDPVVDYLAGLDWDGIERIDEWLTTYLGTADTALNRAIGRIMLVAMVRRARHPGCKFDQIGVLEGPEGILKSTALALLAGAAENFSDQTILGQSDKEQQEQLRGIWVFEIADLTNIRKADVEHVKAFASRTSASACKNLAGKGRSPSALTASKRAAIGAKGAGNEWDTLGHPWGHPRPSKKALFLRHELHWDTYFLRLIKQ